MLLACVCVCVTSAEREPASVSLSACARSRSTDWMRPEAVASSAPLLHSLSHPSLCLGVRADLRAGLSTPCRVHYRGILTDGTEFDSTYSRGAPIILRPDQVVPGWREAPPPPSLSIEGAPRSATQMDSRTGSVHRVERESGWVFCVSVFCQCTLCGHSFRCMHHMHMEHGCVCVSCYVSSDVGESVGFWLKREVARTQARKVTS